MKNNLLFFTLILSGLSTHVFAAGDEEINQELQPTKSSESKKNSERTPSKQENFKFGGKSTYQEGPFKQQSPEEMLEGQSPEVKRLVKQERKKYQASSKVSGSKYSDPTESSESKKNSERTPSKQENFKFGGKSTYQEGPFKQQSPEEMLEGQSPEVKRLVEQERKKYQASSKVSGSKYSDPTESSESKKNSERTPSKQENFKFGGKSTYQEGPLDPVEETPRQKQLKDKVGTRFGKDSNDMQKTLKTAPSDITSTTSENSESF